MRKQYKLYGSVENYYRNNCLNYSNPHINSIRLCLQHAKTNWKIDFSEVLDLACGGGEITSLIGSKDAFDPYTGDLFKNNTGIMCEPFSFEDIALGKAGDRNYSSIIISYAFHLINKSWIYDLLSILSTWSDTILILGPTKNLRIPKGLWNFKNQIKIGKTYIFLYILQKRYALER